MMKGRKEKQERRRRGKKSLRILNGNLFLFAWVVERSGARYAPA
jgi:hypothetical protein